MTAQCGKCSKRHSMKPCNCPLWVPDDPSLVAAAEAAFDALDSLCVATKAEPVQCDGVGVDGERCKNTTYVATDWSWGILTIHKLGPDELHLCGDCLNRALRAIRRRGGQ